MSSMSPIPPPPPSPPALAYTPSTLTVSGANIANYNITVNPGTLTITQATGGLGLAVTVNNASRPYGSPNPTFTCTIAGAVNGDTFTITYSTTATITSGVGTYAINATVSGAAAANYSVIVNSRHAHHHARGDGRRQRAGGHRQ